MPTVWSSAGDRNALAVAIAPKMGDPAHGEVEVRVEDNGPGVEAQLAEELFRPFSQGRSHPGQSGLGLYFCRIAIEQYGGRIGYRDRGGEPGTGACFWFRLPRVTGRQTTKQGKEEA